MYEKSGSCFFKTNTGIQSGLGTLEDSKSAMTFLIILGGTEILNSFRLVSGERAVREIMTHQNLSSQKRFQKGTLRNQMQKTTSQDH